MTRFFSYRDRPVHLGPFPLERLARLAPDAPRPDLTRLPEQPALSFDAGPDELSLAAAMGRYMGMFDVIREGQLAAVPAEIPTDPLQRAEHLKAAAYYFDASMVGICALPPEALRERPLHNPMVERLGAELALGQPKSFASGIDMIYADILQAARTPVLALRPSEHGHALVIAVEYTRDPRADEAGCDWLHGTQAQRAGLLAANTAVLLASYLRLLGFAARSHTVTCSDLHLDRLAVAAGLARIEVGTDGLPVPGNPYLGRRFALAAVSTTMALATDAPLAPPRLGDRWRSHGPRWWLGHGTLKSGLQREPYARRDFKDGAHPFERLQRRDEPTTFIDHERVPRFPKRADFFARALFGDMGKQVQDAARGGHYVLKSPIGACARRALGALLLLQFGPARGPVHPSTLDPARNAERLKACAYYLSTDAVGLCRVPDWAWYSHDAGGEPITPYHPNAINMLLDQGHETMEGASGDDWISVAQSMRAYLRFSLLGGVLAEQLRRLGHEARVHSVLDGDVLQPPLLLLSGLGEVSRIGEVILNPFLGPRLKSGVVTTTMSMAYDRPIDFGLQTFCEGCNKCARECPSGAITAGPKLMYNGYEIWKSDAEKCARYRITNAAGGMCGRCMKTCPWNLEGLFADSGWRWLAINAPSSAPWLAALDDRLDRGSINPVKKWWWDIELDRSSGRYVRAAKVNARGLNKQLRISAASQSLAVYPADLMPPPYPVAYPLQREEGLRRYQALLTPTQYRSRLREGHTEGLVPATRALPAESPVLKLRLARRIDLGAEVARYEFEALDGSALPQVEAGAHVDVVVAPEYLRAYSLAGNPADRSRYVLGVQQEPLARGGRGGSLLMHRVFREGREVFVTRPRNHFPLDEQATFSYLLGGGIGITPLLAMAHRLHALGRDFELHYSAGSRAQAAFADEVAAAPWADKARLHLSNSGQRLDLERLIPVYREGLMLYTCGSARYMDAVLQAGQVSGWPDEALRREYFAAPEQAAGPSHGFSLQLARRGITVAVRADESATEALARAGVPVDVKCADGLCGVCAVGLLAGEADHRDHVLGRREREQRIILCCSRALHEGAELVLDL
ncbi:MAG: 4Fe-4S dicluster domain-containing protein [Burkholderiaceae bacterium]|nr:4Fe-4S dicluster domain-containing protein [Burkholderiaceae bacterium]